MQVLIKLHVPMSTSAQIEDEHNEIEKLFREALELGADNSNIDPNFKLDLTLMVIPTVSRVVVIDLCVDFSRTFYRDDVIAAVRAAWDKATVIAKAGGEHKMLVIITTAIFPK